MNNLKWIERTNRKEGIKLFPFPRFIFEQIKFEDCLNIKFYFPRESIEYKSKLYLIKI